MRNILSGSISALFVISICISTSALIFSGDLYPYLALGLGYVLIGATIANLRGAYGSSFPFEICCPDPNTSVIAAFMLGEIARQAAFPFPTIMMAIVLSTLAIGSAQYLLGKFRLGNMIRFIPYPVLGGFIAGTGWLVLCGAVRIMVGEGGRFELPFLKDTVMLWGPGFFFALTAIIIVKKINHYSVFPSLIVATILLTHCVLLYYGISFESAVNQGLLFKEFPHTLPWERWGSVLDFSFFHHVDWGILAHNAGYFAGLICVIIITLLLNATSLEVISETRGNLDTELKVAGSSNMMAGLFGGFPSILAVSGSLINKKAGSNSRISGLVVGLICIAALFVGPVLISSIPKFVISGILLYIAFGFLYEWIYESWYKLDLLDYSLVIFMVLLIANFGFLPGLLAGILIVSTLFIVRYSRSSLIRYAIKGSEYHSKVSYSVEKETILKGVENQIYILKLQGYLFFGTAYNLRETIENYSHENPTLRFLILDFSLVNGLDSSASFSFKQIAQLSGGKQFSLILTNLSPSIQKQLRDIQVVLSDVPIMIFEDIEHGVEWCERQILAVEKPSLPSAQSTAMFGQFFSDYEQWARFIRYLEYQKFPSGHVLIDQSAQADCLYFIESGQVTASYRGLEGKRIRLNSMGAGTVVGEIGFYLGTPRSAQVVTDQPTMTYRLSHESLEIMKKQDPEIMQIFYEGVVRLLAERLLKANREIEILSR